MFEEDLTKLPTADLLESAAGHRAEVNRLDARLLVHAQIYADRFHPDVCPTRPGRRSCDGRERAVVLGGEGCPAIAEFAIAEFGVILGISPRVAADLIGQSLALRHRFPFTWARVLAGDATPWKARQIAAACVKLTEEAARYIDQRVARLVDSITPYRLDKIVRAAKMHADPESARAEADEKSRERGVFVGSADEHGTKTMYIRAATGDVRRHDATIGDIAEALKIFGDPSSLDARRAKAVGVIADPRYTEELLFQARHQHLAQPSDRSTAAVSGRPASPDHQAESRLASLPNHQAASLPAGQADHQTDPAVAGPRPAALGGDRITDRRAWSSAVPGRGGKLLSDFPSAWLEPGPDDEADRDAPHPSDNELPDPLDLPPRAPLEVPTHALAEQAELGDPGRQIDPGEGAPLDAAAERALNARLAQIKHDAYTRTGTTDAGRDRLRPGKTEIYVHLTDHTLATGSGVLRVEGTGPMLATQLSELVGHGPYVVKPVIDLNEAVSVDAYEIPERIRERVKLTHPVELFPFGTRETHRSMDLDHIKPYDPLGPPGQTSTSNLAPLGRFGHRVKTHAPGWTVRRLDTKTLEWTTPQGFTFHVDPTGTHRVQGSASDRSGPPKEVT
ncbi:hypothetical protein AB0L70_10645 [Kribbella sp. NPDC051952]|uniref:hypothetical protein n=1 Tax=Kribbella sp. NPDC051952 TaxID=3154851 RepID=UPI0034356841